ncbi:carboxymuconolactone decarboxylase family protein [Paenibacillus thalictri]|uniref:Carboxymuconolactone decarboxylase family protein n=1 Tax=Paenibacillus thalictri TaxID=2527873 RepID=A0A4Q9DSU6_9BACL|nr:carboxymuconolactone decarboxylase family protein [Paenibacillus thalictri]TBL79949.1 carboxymuconolactone decarboxylase family protein [Paenibacillus thalictri]
MKVRINHQKANPEVYRTMLKLEQFIKSSGLDPVLYELIKIRASQINGCAFCLDMHTTDLRKMGESERRINLISVWRETTFFTDKEKAALELTEAVTLISQGGVTDALYDKVRSHYDESEYATLIMAINTINNWNRIAISTGMFPGCFDQE